MGLLNQTPAFEAENDASTSTNPDTSAAPAAATDTKKETTASAPAATPPAVRPSGALSTAGAKGNMNALVEMKDALKVDYNTLAQVTTTNGNFVEREGKIVMGDTVVFELLSFQDSFVVSPEDDKAPKELVKYSDDGITTKDGIPVQEALDELFKTGWVKARLRRRTVLVGAIESAAKTDKFNNELMQFDLSPASRTQWERYMANAAYQLKVGRLTEDRAKRVKATAELAQNGSNTYTLAKFVAAA